MLIDFKVDTRFIQDLEDDFIMNEDLNLYEFIGKDPIKAFYLGVNIPKWVEFLDKKQKYLYSKLVRHNKDDIEKYQSQIEYWSDKFPKQEQVSMVELSEYILNNVFWDPKTEEMDRIKMAFFFGYTIGLQQLKDSDEQTDDIH